jgi:hypothetical protein
MRSSTATQFSVEIETKDSLDRYKVEHKEEILAFAKSRKRYVTNTMAIGYLLAQAAKAMAKRKGVKKDGGVVWG